MAENKYPELIPRTLEQRYQFAIISELVELNKNLAPKPKAAPKRAPAKPKTEPKTTTAKKAPAKAKEVKK